MDNIDQLFIRACKSREPEKRILSVYRRFYLSGGEQSYSHLVAILAKIINERIDYPLTDILSDLNPENPWRSASNEGSYWERVFDLLVSKIRLARVSELQGLKAPLKLRKVA